MDNKKEKKEKKPGFFAKLKQGLEKTREGLLGIVFGNSEERISDEFYEELEDALIMADCGFDTTEEILDKLRSKVKELKLSDRGAAKEALIDILTEHMSSDDSFLEEGRDNVILIVGVNGVGKTTSIGKLASMYKAEGMRPMLAAADTFRAGAVEQLKIWADRLKCPIVTGLENGDPASVCYDGAKYAKANKVDLMIVDTAGRLHN